MHSHVYKKKQKKKTTALYRFAHRGCRRWNGFFAPDPLSCLRVTIDWWSSPMGRSSCRRSLPATQHSFQNLHVQYQAKKKYKTKRETILLFSSLSESVTFFRRNKKQKPRKQRYEKLKYKKMKATSWSFKNGLIVTEKLAIRMKIGSKGRKKKQLDWRLLEREKEEDEEDRENNKNNVCNMYSKK